MIKKITKNTIHKLSLELVQLFNSKLKSKYSIKAHYYLNL